MSDYSTEFDYVIEYGRGFREQVAAGDPNPLTGIRIRINGVELTGAPADEDVYYVDDYVFFNLRKILTVLPAVRNGERREVQFYSIPETLVFQPTNDSVRIRFGDDSTTGDEREGATYIVPMEKVVDEFVTTTEEFVERCQSIDPNLADSDELRTLRELVAELER